MTQKPENETIETELNFEKGMADLYWSGLLTTDEFVYSLNHWAGKSESSDYWTEKLQPIMGSAYEPTFEDGPMPSDYYTDIDAQGHITRFYTKA